MIEYHKILPRRVRGYRGGILSALCRAVLAYRIIPSASVKAEYTDDGTRLHVRSLQAMDADFQPDPYHFQVSSDGVNRIVIRCGTWFRQANHTVYVCLLTESDHTAGSGEIVEKKTITTPWTASTRHYVYLMLYNAASANIATSPQSCYAEVSTTAPASVSGGMGSGKYTLIAHFDVDAAGHLDGEIQQDWTGGNIFDAWTFLNSYNTAQGSSPGACLDFVEVQDSYLVPEKRVALFRWMDRTTDAAPHENARVPYQDATDAGGYGPLRWGSPAKLLQTLINIWPESDPGVPYIWPPVWPVQPHAHDAHNSYASDDHVPTGSTSVSWTGSGNTPPDRPGYAMLGKADATTNANQWRRNSRVGENNYLGNGLHIENGLVAWLASGTGLEVKSNTPASASAGSILTAGGVNAALESWFGTALTQVKLGGGTYPVDVSGGTNKVRVGTGGKFVVDAEEFAPYEIIAWKPGTDPPEMVLVRCLAYEP